MSKPYVRNPKPPMPLFTMRGGKPSEEKAFACGECGSVYSSTDSAIYCCQQQVCDSCGGDAPKAWTYCSPCRDKKMWDKAIEIKPEEHDGPVYDESRDKYFESYDEAIEYFMDEDPDDVPQFLQPCTEHACPPLDIDSALENLCEDLFEDAINHLNGVDELRKAVKEFNSKQDLKTWQSDSKRKIRVVTTMEEVQS